MTFNEIIAIVLMVAVVGIVIWDMNHFKWGIEGKDDQGNKYDIWCKLNLADPHKRLKQ